jgi:acylphosphatase
VADRRAHVVVRGRVQGVFFRGETEERARSLGLAGWVRNNGDGSVEAIFEGPQGRVESLVLWCSHGPPGARVDDLEVSWDEAAGLRGFEIV